MAGKSCFVIKRKDKLVQIDDIRIEKEGLTIGRLIGNDLVLNHRAVSRTHAGIKEIEGVFWLFNLSMSNGTLLNGELVDMAPLDDKDRLQIGPFVLQMAYRLEGFTITVEMELEVQPLRGQSAGLQMEQTIKIAIPPLPGQTGHVSGITKRLLGTGFITGFLPTTSEQALNVYWAKRKREAGKVAEITPLHRRSGQNVGKAQFNWRPTLDLKRFRKGSLFLWGSLLVAALALAALFVYGDAYSPGPLSEPHAADKEAGFLAQRNIAARSSASTCSNCHGVGTGMLDKCIECHSTRAFLPRTLIEGHERQQLLCTDCHTEHEGTNLTSGLVSYRLCYQCHNGLYRIKLDGKVGPAGTILPIPHGGTTGYPKIKPGERGGNYWPGLSLDKWRRAVDRWNAINPQNNFLPEVLAARDSYNQFHDLHLGGIPTERQANNRLCAICHFDPNNNTQSYEWKHQSPPRACAKCHAVSFTAAGMAREPANCKTCHQQHGQNREILNVARIVADPGKEGEFLTALAQPVEGIDNTSLIRGTGGADILRQNEKIARPENVASGFGGLPWYGWVALLGLLPMTGLTFMAAGSLRRKHLLQNSKASAISTDELDALGRLRRKITGSLEEDQAASDIPSYPHPVIDPLLCIGCYACVEACPHDVLAMVNGISVPVAIDQCLEDTGCQVECPTVPKACVVVNATKKIPARKVPNRDHEFMTSVYGVYIIGDVSGVPLIKNAINEGGKVIDYIAREIQNQGPAPEDAYDVAIIGMGPAGLSAAVVAKQRGLRYVAIEQDKVLATIQTYPAGKAIFFKPERMRASGGLIVPSLPSQQKEEILQIWLNTIAETRVEIQEEERCKSIRAEAGLFNIVTEKGERRTEMAYLARQIVLAIGNRGTPQKLYVPGEDLKIMAQRRSNAAPVCRLCNASSPLTARFCPRCGFPIEEPQSEIFLDDKVKYKLSDPDHYVNKRCIVVGAGNSAIEAAVALCGLRRDEDEINFIRNNTVTLVIRSDFKSDLKLANKIDAYDCNDRGRLTVLFDTQIKEITENEVVLIETGSKKETARLACDYIFALIGGEKPTRFLESIGIKIG